jgi:hypothetical protein
MPESYWERLFQNLERFSLPILLIVVLIALILIYVFFPNNSVDQNKLRLEFVKLLIQLLLIGLFGGIFGGIFLQEYNRRRERNIALNEYRKKLLDKLTHSYFKAKKARRILEANINNPVNDKTTVREVYDTQIKEIIDAQLEFEFYYNQLQAIPHVFSDKTTKELVNLTKKIEHNLNLIINEYKKFTKSPEKTIAQLPKLNEFIHRKTFKQDFSNYVHVTFVLIQDEIF